MYGHVCETKGTRKGLSPCPLQNFTCKDLLESQDGLRKPFVWTKSLQLIAYDCVQRLQQTPSKRATRRKIVLWAGATIRGRPATYIIDSSKYWANCSEGYLIVSVFCVHSAVLGATPALSANFCHTELVIDSICVFLFFLSLVSLPRRRFERGCWGESV